VVIDDCSEDRTADAAKEAGAIVLPLAVRLGAWGAIQTGLRFAELHQWPMAVTLDGDGQHEPAYIGDLIAPVLSGDADLVIGAYPGRAGLLRSTAWGYFRWLTRLRIEDMTSGFRAYSRAAIERLAHTDATLLEYQDLGSLMLLRENGLRATEVSVTMGPRLTGQSRVFHSSGAVIHYILHTSVICLALGRYERRRRRSRRADR
jgi:hypothetical protein